MLKQKHTPDTWHMVETEPGIEAEADIFVTTPRYAGGAGLIARVINADDAMLIAAAPDLLKALYELVDDLGTPEDGIQADLMNAAHAAILKATGESK
jgi:hypothetical protein